MGHSIECFTEVHHKSIFTLRYSTSVLLDEVEDWWNPRPHGSEAMLTCLEDAVRLWVIHHLFSNNVLLELEED